MQSERPKTAAEVSGPPPIDKTLCLNCSCELAGSFCHECGQPASTKKYSLRTIGTEIYEQFRKIDTLTMMRTFWRLTTQPGEFITAYLSGKRVGFLVPVKYFFYSFVVQILVGSWLFWLTKDHSFDQMSHVEFRAEIVTFVSTGFWGILWWIFYRRSDLNIVEYMVIAILFVAQINFFGIILDLVSFPFVSADVITKGLAQVLGLLLQYGYAFYFVRKLFRERYLLLISKQLLLSLLFFLMVIVVFLVAFGFEAATEQLKNLK